LSSVVAAAPDEVSELEAAVALSLPEELVELSAALALGSEDEDDAAAGDEALLLSVAMPDVSLPAAVLLAAADGSLDVVAGALDDDCARAGSAAIKLAAAAPAKRIFRVIWRSPVRPDPCRAFLRLRKTTVPSWP
jgi:hypothetical protein